METLKPFKATVRKASNTTLAITVPMSHRKIYEIEVDDELFIVAHLVKKSSQGLSARSETARLDKGDVVCPGLFIYYSVGARASEDHSAQLGVPA